MVVTTNSKRSSSVGSAPTSTTSNATTATTTTNHNNELSSRPRNKKKLGINTTPGINNRNSVRTTFYASPASSPTLATMQPPLSPPPIPPPPPGNLFDDYNMSPTSPSTYFSANTTPTTILSPTSMNPVNNHNHSTSFGSKLKPIMSQTSTIATKSLYNGISNNSSSNSSSTGKLLTTISTSVKSLTPQASSQMSSKNIIMKSVGGANAKFYSDEEIKTKLKLLICSDNKFDEIIEFGFPIVPDDRDLEYLRLYGHGSRNNSTSSGISASSDDLHRRLHEPIDQFNNLRRGSENGLVEGRGNGQIPLLLDTPRTPSIGDINGLPGSPASEVVSFKSPNSKFLNSVNAVPREMTLKITLSPPGMRADEEAIYGWQRDHIDTGTMKSVRSLGAVEEDAEELFQMPMPQPQGLLDSPTSPQSGNKIKKVFRFGKLRKPKVSTNTYMITSADMK